MTLPRDSWQEESLEQGLQEQIPGSDPHAAPSGITEEHVSVQGTETSLDTSITSTREGAHHLGRSHQAIQFISVQTLLRLTFIHQSCLHQVDKSTARLHSPPTQSQNIQTPAFQYQDEEREFRKNTRREVAPQRYLASFPSSHLWPCMSPSQLL